MLQQLFDGLPTHRHVLRMHGVFTDGLTLHRLKRSCSYVQRQFLAVDTFSVEIGQHLRRKVQPSGRSRHTALYLRIHRLVRPFVALLRLAVQVRRDGQLTHRVDNFGKGERLSP